jgi:hypothetical protein
LSNAPRKLRYWHLADIELEGAARPLSGAKQTYANPVADFC